MRLQHMAPHGEHHMLFKTPPGWHSKTHDTLLCVTPVDTRAYNLACTDVVYRRTIVSWFALDGCLDIQSWGCATSAQAPHLDVEAVDVCWRPSLLS